MPLVSAVVGCVTGYDEIRVCGSVWICLDLCICGCIWTCWDVCGCVDMLNVLNACFRVCACFYLFLDAALAKVIHRFLFFIIIIIILIIYRD
jgi:hypothetical protein